MYLVSIAPVSPVEKPKRIVCKNEDELLAEIRTLSVTPDFVSYLVERVLSYEHSEGIKLD